MASKDKKNKASKHKPYYEPIGDEIEVFSLLIPTSYLFYSKVRRDAEKLDLWSLWLGN